MTSRWPQLSTDGRLLMNAETFFIPHGPLGPILRTISVVCLGALMALFLAWFMFYLIEQSEMRLSEATNTQLLDFVRMKRDETVERKDRKPQRPVQNNVPDAPPTADASANAGEQLAVSLGAPEVGADMGIEGVGIGGDSEYLPIVKVAPIYPRRALARGVTGTCVVQYTVTTSGTVRDVSVVESMCTDDVFIKPSIEAALRFKYKPRLIDGVAVEVQGVYNKFYYEELGESAQ